MPDACVPLTGASGVAVERRAWHQRDRGAVVVFGANTTPGAHRTRAPVPARWRSWAELLARVFLVDGWACPRCKVRMRFRAGTVLRDLHRSARGPPLPLPPPDRADGVGRRRAAELRLAYPRPITASRSRVTQGSVMAIH